MCALRKMGFTMTWCLVSITGQCYLYMCIIKNFKHTMYTSLKFIFALYTEPNNKRNYLFVKISLINCRFKKKKLNEYNVYNIIYIPVYRYLYEYVTQRLISPRGKPRGKFCTQKPETKCFAIYSKTCYVKILFLMARVWHFTFRCLTCITSNCSLHHNIL